MKTKDLKKVEEMHHWKLSEVEGRRESPPFTGSVMVSVGGQAIGLGERGKGVEVLRASTVHLCPASWQLRALGPQSRLQRKKLIFF